MRSPGPRRTDLSTFSEAPRSTDRRRFAADRGQVEKKKNLKIFSPNVFGHGNAISGESDFTLFHEISLGYMGGVMSRPFPFQNPQTKGTIYGVQDDV